MTVRNDENPERQTSDQPPWHAIPANRCLDLVGSSRDGLSEAEAQKRFRNDGPNELPGRKPPTIAHLFLRQFRSPLIYLLLAATLISLVGGHNLDAAFIGVVLTLNAIVGTFQERRADASMATLDKLIRHAARARRDGQVREIEACELVVGDVVEFESGMAVPADIRLLVSNGLFADESALSGESLPVLKDAARQADHSASLADRPTMLHAGTVIAEGRGTGLVVATAFATALGSIQASLASSPAAPPPLVLRLRRLSRDIAVGAIVLIAILAAVLGIQGEPLDRILLLSVALAVSAIPEGLPIAVTVALAAAVRRMARRNVIVRSLPAVEGLGSCTLIASDKTGTLTLNRLSLEQVLLPDGQLLGPEAWRGQEAGPLAALARAAALCNEASLAPDDLIVGDTVDVALAEFAREGGLDLRRLFSADRPAMLPYEPARRFSAVAIAGDEGTEVFVKGAPEVVLPMCSDVREEIAERAERLAGEGYRLLALATDRFASDTIPDCRAPHDLRLLGWVALLDPVRPEAAAAIARCAEAGISVRMITGDHPATARTIAAQLGLACTSEELVTGAELTTLRHDPSRLAEIVRGGVVFARIEPAQKLLIVEILSAEGELVAVTGDGVNDAPALQAAHIGVAMGQAGTDVARGAADLVLADDNFASIVAGVEEGRITYANVRKIVIFLLATGVAEISMFLGAVAAGLPMPLTAIQLLWLNLVTNGVQDVMLGFGRGEGDELRRKPRRPKEPILDRTAVLLMIPPALTMTALAIVLIHWSLGRGFDLHQVQNAVLLLVVLFQNVYVLCMRSERRPLLREPILSNPWLLGGVALALSLQVGAMHWDPLRAILGTSPVDRETLAFCLAGAVLIAMVTELTKWLARSIWSARRQEQRSGPAPASDASDTCSDRAIAPRRP